MYLSDNSTGTVTIYSGAAPFPQIGALNHAAGASYGWGVGDTGPHQDAPGARNEVYVGASNDTIDVYDACKGMAVLRTLTGNGGGNGGAPYGLAVGDDGSVVADEWPNNAIDVWGPLPGEPLEGTVPEANMNLPYFLYYDNADPGAPGTAYVLVSGVSAGGAEQIDDCTLAFGPPPVLNCRTAITIAGGFPGGVAGLEISATRQNRGHKPNVIVDNQYGVLSAYGCDFPPPPGAITCIDRADFMYSNGQNPLDYTAIDVAWFPHNNARNLGAANIYFCNANKTTFCGDFTSQSLPLPWGPGWMLNGNSAQLGPPSMPLGFKIWPPNPHS
ncbi:MAG: hypothetical protein JO043_06905 [Candidatus Eremiobacteraeota bacterium]|nr:hypothetical protein [Candidatus Eremiobacteraeota bacterium]